jgi:hypothetical protein
MTVALVYPDTPCRACGRPHTLRLRGPRRPRPGAAFRYTCPATGVLVVVRPRGRPVPADPPADAVPAEPLPA